MHNVHIQYKAKSMRLNGTSIGEISHQLKISKSTVSFWCKDIELKDSAIEKIKVKGREKSVQGLLRYSELKRKDRTQRHAEQKQEGANLIEHLTERDLLMAGLGLYWGEGYKGGGELGFTNSNPKMITFYLKWLKIFGVLKSDLIFRLTINNLFKSDQKEIETFWLKLLDVKKDQFSKTTVIKTTLKKGFIKDMSKYKGILRVKVRRGLGLKNKILGAIDYISTCV
jgi:hypothetical protein